MIRAGDESSGDDQKVWEAGVPWEPDDPGQGRIIRTCAEGFGKFDRMIRPGSGSSGFVQKVLPEKMTLMKEF